MHSFSLRCSNPLNEVDDTIWIQLDLATIVEADSGTEGSEVNPKRLFAITGVDGFVVDSPVGVIESTAVE